MILDIYNDSIKYSIKKLKITVLLWTNIIFNIYPMDDISLNINPLSECKFKFKICQFNCTGSTYINPRIFIFRIWIQNTRNLHPRND